MLNKSQKKKKKKLTEPLNSDRNSIISKAKCTGLVS